MKYYALFENGKLFTTTTDDMNSTEDWAQSGIIYADKALAEQALEYWSDFTDGKMELKEL